MTPEAFRNPRSFKEDRIGQVGVIVAVALVLAMIIAGVIAG